MVPIQGTLHPTSFSAPSAYAFELTCMPARDRIARPVITHLALPPGIVSRGQATAERRLTDYYRDLQSKCRRRPRAGSLVPYRL